MSEPENLSESQWLKARVIFDKAQATPAQERALLLREMCDEDHALLAELESLLEASEAEEMVSEALADVVGPGNDSLGRSVGPYELERLLGRGGMGSVYLAHRADGQFRQQVAIKLIDVPIASELFRRQFRLERQILAGLSHPFIAKLFDGGVTAEGELYLAMEYVDGVQILDYCERNQLSLRARLVLFFKVCNAVQYAHQNLVVHRDLKPANILVDGDGTPHLLDFGTAKLLSPALEDRASDLTLHGLRSFTPQYASPEQVLGKAVSTSSDIYSLGVILFQLLADVAPYALRELNTEEMLRVICEEQPPKPSAVAVSAERPDADLDCIVLMALRKESSERYLTVQQFAADIEAWLDGRPVLARRGSLRYYSLKFAKRNKVALTAAALLLAVILCGMAAVLWQSRVANMQRIRAEENVQEMCELSSNFLSEIDQAVKQLPNSTPVRRLMVQRVAEHLDRVPRNAAGSRLTGLYLVKAYLQLGRLQGSPVEQSIGDATGALLSVEKALSMARGLKSEYPNDREVTDDLALALKTKSLILYGLGKPEEAASILRQAIDMLSKEADDPDATTAQIANAAKAFNLLGAELGEPETPSAGDYSAALAAFEKSIDLYARSLAIDPGFVTAKSEIAKNREQIAHILIFTDPVAAVDELRNALALWDALPVSAKSNAENKLDALFTRDLLGKALTRSRDYRSAILIYEETRKSMEERVKWDAADSRAVTFLAGMLGDEAETYIDMLNPVLNARSGENRQKNIGQATGLLRRSIALNEKLVAMDPNDAMFSAYLAYQNALLCTLRPSTASPNDDCQAAAASVAQLRKLASSSDASSEVLYRAASVMASDLPARLRDTRLAVQYAERLVALNHRQDPNSLSILAQAYLEDGQPEKAAEAAHEGLSRLAPQRPGTLAIRCRVLLEYTLTKVPRSQ
jgi:serine/threonine protein kinase